jgi:hypothetical protein
MATLLLVSRFGRGCHDAQAIGLSVWMLCVCVEPAADAPWKRRRPPTGRGRAAHPCHEWPCGSPGNAVSHGSTAPCPPAVWPRAPISAPHHFVPSASPRGLCVRCVPAVARRQARGGTYRIQVREVGRWLHELGEGGIVPLGYPVQVLPALRKRRHGHGLPVARRTYQPGRQPCRHRKRWRARWDTVAPRRGPRQRQVHMLVPLGLAPSAPPLRRTGAWGVTHCGLPRHVHLQSLTVSCAPPLELRVPTDALPCSASPSKRISNRERTFQNQEMQQSGTLIPDGGRSLRRPTPVMPATRPCRGATSLQQRAARCAATVTAA